MASMLNWIARLQPSSLNGQKSSERVCKVRMMLACEAIPRDCCSGRFAFELPFSTWIHWICPSWWIHSRSCVPAVWSCLIGQIPWKLHREISTRYLRWPWWKTDSDGAQGSHSSLWRWKLSGTEHFLLKLYMRFKYLYRMIISMSRLHLFCWRARGELIGHFLQSTGVYKSCERGAESPSGHVEPNSSKR